MCYAFQHFGVTGMSINAPMLHPHSWWGMIDRPDSHVRDSESIGDLSRSLGVNNASCKLLVDQLASRGVWRGVNRTSIIVGAAVLASVTVEDPIKHVRHAAFTGTKDNLSGSSANVLTGGPITFGTNGMSLLLDIKPLLTETH